MPLHRKILLLLTLGLCLGCKLRAQHFPFFNLKIENGLAQSQVTCMTQDSFGNLWVGTLGGISRYDGKKFTNYTRSEGLVSNMVLALQFDRKGRLLIFTNEGLQSFDGSTFSILPTISKHISPYTLAVTNSNQVLYIINGAIYAVGKPSKPYISLPGNNIATMLQQEGDKLYVSDATGSMYVYRPNEHTPSEILKCSDSTLNVLKVLTDSKARTWFLCNKGLYHKQDNRIVPYLLPGFGRSINVPLLSGAEDRNGQLWLGTVSGVLRMDTEGDVRHFNEPTGLSNNIIYAVLKDKEGNMWFGSDGQGIFRYSGGPFISLDRSFGLPDNQIIGITGDEQRTIYFACYSGNICSYSLGEKVSNLDIKELGSAMVSCIAYQQGAGLWIAARGRGLYLYRNGRASYFPLNARESGALSISSLYTDRRNRLWVVMGPELVYLDQGKQTVVPLDGLTADCIAQVGEDSILIASNNGLLLYNGQALQPMVTGQLPDSLHIQCMTERDGKWILGTGDQGIVIYDTHSSKSTVFNKRNGLSSDFIYNIVTDSNGNIMAGTGLGISRISFDEAGRAAVMNYGKANGVAGLESNANAVFATPSGQIWFGTTEGACCYIPSARTIAAAPISIVLESVKLFGGKDIDPAYYTRQAGWYHIPDELELPYQHNNISLSFQAITLSPADKILYRYKLKGTETPWSEWSPENAVTFSALDPGTYTFVVECSINGRKEHTAPLQYTFCIKTPFHKSVWFVLSILGLCTLLGVYLQYSANKRKQNRIKREQALRREEQTRVRERTAEDFHDEVGNKLTRINVLTNILKAKMAPGNQDADRIIKQIQDNTQQLYSGTRDILWSLQSSNDNLYEIVNHVRDLAGELYSDTEINFSLSGNEPALKDIKMPLDKSRNFIMIWKEALNNALKYARAHHIHMAVVQEEHGFICVSLADDGAGFDEQTIKYGNGLKNMRARAERMGGQLDISTIENRGTKITLRFPYS